MTRTHHRQMSLSLGDNRNAKRNNYAECQEIRFRRSSLSTHHAFHSETTLRHAWRSRLPPLHASGSALNHTLLASLFTPVDFDKSKHGRMIDEIHSNGNLVQHLVHLRWIIEYGAVEHCVS